MYVRFGSACCPFLPYPLEECDLDKKNNSSSQSVLLFTFLFLKFYFIFLFQTGTSAWQDQINHERLAKEKLGLGWLNKSLKSFQIMRRSQLRSFFKKIWILPPFSGLQMVSFNAIISFKYTHNRSDGLSYLAFFFLRLTKED